MKRTFTDYDEEDIKRFGWREVLITRYFKKIQKLVDEKNCDFNISYVKDKRWRFDITCSWCEECMELAFELEAQSMNYCRVCWKKWEPREDLWWIDTLCDEHYNMRTDRIRDK